MKRKAISALLAVFLLLWDAMPALAAEEAAQAPETETIIIATEDDFLSFAQSCVLDCWSRDKLVVLQADLHLENSEVLPVPTFGGVFDGSGHHITGLTVTHAVAPAGLFGNLQSTAVIKNLCVQGSVTPSGDCSAVGGIAGENYGRIENCTFSGVVSGQTNTGAIAGSNFGTIKDCSADGSSAGSSRTGGICGYNDGQIIACRNAASVNTDSIDPTWSSAKPKLDFTLDFSKISDLDVTNAASDTGGVAGYSSGSIISCENTGNIGYPHIGYNLGGIAGRSCGFMENCENKGKIYGRKDVGGVVGQIEPHIQTVLSPDYLETLSKQFENLGSLVNSAGIDGAEIGGNIQDSIQVITGYQSAAQSAIGELISSADSGKVNEDALDALRSAVQGMAGASDDLRNDIGSGVDVMSQDISAISGQINAISRTFALATEDAKQTTITDLSDADITDILEGRVLNCVNTGSVEADLNVGGITGTMGLESTADPEDDMPSGSITQQRRYELKAIADSCENIGTVTGKRSCVGGICGRMELGLITQCRGYGRIESKNGDYVGGIAGLASGTVRDCFAKCALSGNKYIGGIVGSGIAADYYGDSSTVTGCCSMVDILDSKQYAGAISGVYAGVFTGNYFVSDTLAGIDRVSYAALAEPVSYAKMLTLRELPQSLQELTLRFVADGQTVKTLSFHYGDSFDDSDFPDIPQKEGYYARWNIRDLTNLHLDTVVEANYLPYITALNSTDNRVGERPIFFVQGQFQERDILETAPGKSEFTAGADQKILEQWHLSVPADGLASHTIRYLPIQEKVQLYLLKSGSWSRIQPEAMGAYLAFDAAGSDVEIAVTTADSAGRCRELILAGLIALILLAGMFALKRIKHVRNKKKEKQSSTGKRSRKVWITLPILLAAALAIAVRMYAPRTEVVQAIHIYDVMKNYIQQPEQKMKLSVMARIEDKDSDFSAEIDVTDISGHTLSVISENGRSLYYSDGIIFVGNGDAFRLNGTAPDYSGLMGQVLAISQKVQIESADNVYTITADGTQAAKIAQLLLPSVYDLLPKAMSLTVEIETAQDALKQLRITGAGNLADSVKTPFSLSAIVDILQPEPVHVPDAVIQKVLARDCHPQEIFSDELVRLLQAWTQLRGRDSVAAEVHLTADCSALTLDDSFLCYQWKAGETRIYGTDKTGSMLYFGENKVCNSNGREVYVQKASEMDITGLADVLYRAFRDAQFKCRQEGTDTLYTVSLKPAGMKELSEAILPAAKKMDITYSQGSICLILKNNQIQSIQVSCGGSAKVVAVYADITLDMNITLADGKIQALPEAVLHALAGQESSD